MGTALDNHGYGRNFTVPGDYEHDKCATRTSWIDSKCMVLYKYQWTSEQNEQSCQTV